MTGLRTAVIAAVWLVPSVVLAAGGGGGVTLKDVLTGDHAVEFWGALVNFGLLVTILVMASRKPLAGFLGMRREEMEKTMREAAAAKSKAEARYKEYTDRLAGLDAELAKLREDIERSAEEDKQRILADAQASADRLRADAETLVKQHAEALERKVRAEVVESAISTAEKVLRDTIKADDQQRLAEAYRRDVVTDQGGRPA